MRNRHVGNLLFDSSRAVVVVGDTEYNRLICEVSMKLKETLLKKVFCVVSRNIKLEEMAVQMQGEVLRQALCSTAAKRRAAWRRSVI